MHDYLLVLDAEFVIHIKGEPFGFKVTKDFFRTVGFVIVRNFSWKKYVPSETKVRDNQQKPVLVFLIKRCEGYRMSLSSAILIFCDLSTDVPSQCSLLRNFERRH